MQFRQKGSILSQEVFCLPDSTRSPVLNGKNLFHRKGPSELQLNPRFWPSPWRLYRPFSTIILHLVTETLPATQIHRVLKMVIWSKM